MSIYIQKTIVILLKLITLPLICLYELVQLIWIWLNSNNFIETTSKAVLITGCDSGFGKRATAIFLERAVNVFAACYTEKGVTALKSKNDLVRPLRLDITSEASVAAAASLVETWCSESGFVLWAVINNAGITPPFVPLDWLNYEDFSRTVEVNLLGHIRCTLAFAPLVEASRGRVVLVSSGLGYAAVPYATPYIAAKYGLRGFGEALRLDLLPKRVRVSIVAPGFHQTPIIGNGSSWKKRWNELPESIKKDYPIETVEPLFERKTKKLQDVLDACDVDEVCNVYFHATFAKYPRTVYFVGNEVCYYDLASLLPLEISGKMAELTT